MIRYFFKKITKIMPLSRFIVSWFSGYITNFVLPIQRRKMVEELTNRLSN